MELVRKILFEIEKYPTGFVTQELEIEGYTADQIVQSRVSKVGSGMSID